jgi:2-polyprenyl-6-methoxyphenol hydroxylase-like FAD-dependent oxidoreductase
VKRSAIVVGAGIGGLAVARGMARAGWRVALYEQASAFGAVGAGLALQPNAVRAFDWLGLGGQLRAHGLRSGPYGLRTPRGRWLSRVSLEQLQRRYGIPVFVLHRADVHQILSEGLADSSAVSLSLGHRATSLTSRPGSAAVSFQTSTGEITAEADLVVAADGVNSALRSSVFPEHPLPAYKCDC